MHTFEHFFQQLNSFSENPATSTPSIILNGQCENTLKIIHALPEQVRRFWVFDDKARAKAFDPAGDRYLIQAEQDGFSLLSYTASQWQNINRTDAPTETLKLKIPGWHNVWNASMVAIVALQLGISYDDIDKGLYAFTGMGRRFEVLGCYKNALWVDDYAHHPTEVLVTLDAARQRMQELSLNGKLVACFQPHRYTRLQALWNGFLDAFQSADVVYMVDTYHAFEAPILGINSEDFVKALKAKHPQQNIHYAPDIEALKTTLEQNAQAGDLILSMGAGTITHLLRKIPFDSVGSKEETF